MGTSTIQVKFENNDSIKVTGLLFHRRANTQFTKSYAYDEYLNNKHTWHCPMREYVIGYRRDQQTRIIFLLSDWQNLLKGDSKQYEIATFDSYRREWIENFNPERGFTGFEFSNLAPTLATQYEGHYIFNPDYHQPNNTASDTFVELEKHVYENPPAMWWHIKKGAFCYLQPRGNFALSGGEFYDEARISGDIGMVYQIPPGESGEFSWQEIAEKEVVQRDPDGRLIKSTVQNWVRSSLRMREFRGNGKDVKSSHWLDGWEELGAHRSEVEQKLFEQQQKLQEQQLHSVEASEPSSAARSDSHHESRNDSNDRDWNYNRWKGNYKRKDYNKGKNKGWDDKGKSSKDKNDNNKGWDNDNKGKKGGKDKNNDDWDNEKGNNKGWDNDNKGKKGGKDKNDNIWEEYRPGHGSIMKDLDGEKGDRNKGKDKNNKGWSSRWSWNEKGKGKGWDNEKGKGKNNEKGKGKGWNNRYEKGKNEKGEFIESYNNFLQTESKDNNYKGKKDCDRIENYDQFKSHK